MYKFLTFLFILGSCTGSQQEAPIKVAPPGASQVAQIYVLLDKSRPKIFGALNSEFIEKELLTRVVVGRASNLSEAKEVLRQWHARPMQFLILGEGLPQLAWAQEAPKLMKRLDRKVVGLSEFRTAKPQAYVDIVLKIWSHRIEDFIAELCKERASKWSCEVVGMELPNGLKTYSKEKADILITVEDRSLDIQTQLQRPHIKVFVNWVEVLRELIKKPDNLKNWELNFANGLLDIQIEELSSFKSAKDLEKFIRDWQIKELSRVI